MVKYFCDDPECGREVSTTQAVRSLDMTGKVWCDKHHPEESKVEYKLVVKDGIIHESGARQRPALSFVNAISGEGGMKRGVFVTPACCPSCGAWPDKSGMITHIGNCGALA